MVIEVRIGRWVAAACLLLLPWGALGCDSGSRGDEKGGLVREQGKEQDHRPGGTGRRGHSLPFERQLEDEFLEDRHGRPFKFLSAQPIGRDQVRILGAIGACRVAPHSVPGAVPEIKRVRQFHTRKAIVLTPIIVRPKSKSSACLGFVSPLRYTVRIPGGLRGRPIYDGSQSPPVKRWPKEGAAKVNRSRHRLEKLHSVPDWLRGRQYVGVEVEDGSGAALFDQPTDIAVSFGRHHMGWGANCNGYGAMAGVVAGRLQTRSTSGTLMSCPGTGNRQDDWLAAFFSQGLRFRRHGMYLVLSSDDQILQLREKRGRSK